MRINITWLLSYRANKNNFSYQKLGIIVRFYILYKVVYREYTTQENKIIHFKNYKWKIILFKFYLIYKCKPKIMPITHYGMLFIVTCDFLSKSILESISKSLYFLGYNDYIYFLVLEWIYNYFMIHKYFTVNTKL